MNFWISLCTLLSVTIFGALPAPYDEVDLLPFNGQGWYVNASTMEWLLRRQNAKTIIEVGSWLGSSTRHIAKTIPEDGVVYAVDHWLGSANEDNSPFDIPNLYRQFLSNVIHEGLTDKIVPVRMTSVEAAMTLDVVPDLIYIDATHEYSSVLQDLILWYPFVKGHGTLCGDDYFWGDDPAAGGGPVKRAVDTFAAQNHLTVYNDGWLWYLEEF
jgi:hypothetical protein